MWFVLKWFDHVQLDTAIRINKKKQKKNKSSERLVLQFSSGDCSSKICFYQRFFFFFIRLRHCVANSLNTAINRFRCCINRFVYSNEVKKWRTTNKWNEFSIFIHSIRINAYKFHNQLATWKYNYFFSSALKSPV